MIVNRYVRTGLEIPIVGTFESFDNIQLSKGKFGIWYLMVSTICPLLESHFQQLLKVF